MRLLGDRDRIQMLAQPEEVLVGSPAVAGLRDDGAGVACVRPARSSSIASV